MGQRTFRQFAVALVACGSLVTALPAQQPVSEPAPPDTRAGPTAIDPVGPRLAPAWPRVEPRLAGSAEPAVYRKKDGVVIRMSTLVLVLCVIILVLLIA